MNSRAIEILSNSEWLSTLPDSSRSELLATAIYKQFESGQVVHRKGDSADGLYGVIDGVVKVSTNTYSGQNIVFSQIFTNGWFGEIAVLDSGTRTHDAVAAVPSNLILIPKEPITRLLEKDPLVFKSLTQLLCQHTRQAFLAIDDFLSLSPEQRLAKVVVAAAQVNAESKVSLNQEELGATVGLSRQSINKTLRKWQEKGLIQLTYGGLFILDASRLGAIADT